MRGSNNQYVSSENGTQAMRCNRATVGGWEQFTVVDAGGGKVALRSQSKYVSSENGAASITCSRTTFGDWEKFDWIVNADGKISLRGNNGRYISSENGTIAMTCTRTSIGGWEAFTWGGGTGASSSSSGRVATSQPEEEIESVIESNGLSVFPNPASGTVTIRVSQPSTINIVDVTGKSILKKFVNESLTVDNLKSGVYVVQQHNSNKVSTTKFVVK